MHPDDSATLANLAISQAVNLIRRALGVDEDMVLMTECQAYVSVDLWLLVLCKGRDGVVFAVTDGPLGNLREYHEFDTIDVAKALYWEVRGSGSWFEYHQDHPVLIGGAGGRRRKGGRA